MVLLWVRSWYVSFFLASWGSGGCSNCLGCVVELLSTKNRHSALISLCLLCFVTAFATAASMSSGLGIALKHLWRSTLRFPLCSSRFLSLSSNSTHFCIRLSRSIIFYFSMCSVLLNAAGVPLMSSFTSSEKSAKSSVLMIFPMMVLPLFTI